MNPLTKHKFQYTWADTDYSLGYEAGLQDAQQGSAYFPNAWGRPSVLFVSRFQKGYAKGYERGQQESQEVE